MKTNIKIILFISAIFLLLNSGGWGFLEPSESRYAEISKEMMVNNDYLNPTLLQIKHYHKPPVTYYITTLGYRLFGFNSFAARFFLQISLLIQILLVYKIALLLYQNKKMALGAAMIYFSLPLVLISTRNLTTDSYLSTFILASIFFWLSQKKGNHKTLFIYLFYVGLGLIFETKGPVGLLFVLAFIIAYKWIHKEKIQFGIHHSIGILVFIMVASAWYIMLYLDNPNVLNYFLKNQISDRITSSSFNRGKPFWYYLVTIPLLSIPAFLVLSVSFKKKFKKINDKNTLVLVATTLALFVLFSIFKTKLILYVLPLFGFIAILTAKVIFESSDKYLIYYNRILIGLMVVLITAFLITPLIQIDYVVDIKYSIFIGLLLLVAIVFINKYQKGFYKTTFLFYLFGCLLLQSSAHFLKENESNLYSVKEVFQFIDKELNKTDTVYLFNYLISSGNFYTTKNIVTLNNGHNTVKRETFFEDNDDWKNNLIDFRTQAGKEQVMSNLDNPTVLLARQRDRLPDLFTYTHKKIFGKWILYY